MRRYTIAVNGNTYSLDVRELTEHTFEVQLGDQHLQVELVEDSDLPQATISPEMSAALAAVPLAASPPPPAPTQTGASVPPVALPRPAMTNTAVPGPKTLGAPMPGAIEAIQVAPGAAVRRGDVLITLDAMKMINAIRAPRDAVVAEVLVQVGQTVAFGDPLLRFEG